MPELTGDLFATKGLEYVLVIGYLLLLVLCWRFVRPLRSARAATGEAGDGAEGLFRLHEGYYYHPGHTWAHGGVDGVMRVGIDDLVPDLLGEISAIRLPAAGEPLAAGEPGWGLRVEDRWIPVVAPVDGTVLARNEDAVRSPAVVGREPYGDGWLLEVRVADPVVAKRNLLAGPFARAWRDEVLKQLERLSSGVIHELPEEDRQVGLARAVDADAWDRLARGVLLTDGAGRPESGPPPGVWEDSGAEREQAELA
ncbi:MAG: glycine cleavage system protein H [Longimicrobiales bacterium]|nr:glycine cleavage system protein H [Longimicrobiales bacterium]